VPPRVPVPPRVAGLFFFATFFAAFFLALAMSILR
jgi:hypothetical protein